MSSSQAAQPIVRGVVQLPANSTRVVDADEEVFLLYTDLAARKAADGSNGFRGLGHIDSHEDTLTITLNLGVPAKPGGDLGDAAGQDKPGRGVHKKRVRSNRNAVEQTLEVEILQDKTALRSRKGDTGSVVWHASVDFAQAVLQQLHAKNTAGLLNPEQLAASHVIELGAGTGLLAVVLAPFTRHYTVTDIDDLVPLIRKNIARNHANPPGAPSKRRSSFSPPSSSKITAVPLDWIEIRNASATLRRKLVPAEPADLLLVVDCIYHPSLIPPLLSTIDYLAVPGRTAVVVVVELRAEDVVREFLQGWLDLSPAGEWEIWSVSGFLKGPYAIWIGWKHTSAEGIS
ncbi:putative methyltransferase-domain-containing protein [Cubamyces lactineus]|nr:putative methyltransferase-domain-containing protein [Cubamyces lactineus]